MIKTICFGEQYILIKQKYHTDVSSSTSLFIEILRKCVALLNNVKMNISPKYDKNCKFWRSIVCGEGYPFVSNVCLQSLLNKNLSKP